MRRENIGVFASALLLCGQSVVAQVPGIVDAEVDFGFELRDWDGFGVNYVETAQTYNYKEYPQDYGGFTILSDKSKNEIMELTFGEDGLAPSLVKVFLDPLHQEVEGGAYDHKTTTKNLRYFVKEGERITNKRGEKLTAITTMYSAPAYTTVQNKLRGRDINMEKLPAIADYMTDWVDFLINEENINLKYISINNEGESWRRWEADGGADALYDKEGHDYNVYMTPETTVKVMRELRKSLDREGLEEVGVTNGEPSNWHRFWAWNYAATIARDEQAVKDLGLITSHGFFTGYLYTPRWFGTHSSNGTAMLREKKPDLHAWTTSVSWNVREEDTAGNKTFIMDPAVLKVMHGNIYDAHCNAIIPWALLQHASNWNKPDPNPGCGFRVYDDGTWEIKKGYYYYKQLSRAGRANTKVVHAVANDTEIAMLGWGKGDTDNPNAFVVVNWGKETFESRIKITDCDASQWDAYRTSGREIHKAYDPAQRKYPAGENYKSIGTFEVKDGYSYYNIPPMSATPFFEIQ